MFSIARMAVSRLAVKMLAPSPYLESLARAIASSASRATVTERTGPKISSVVGSDPWRTPVSTVGSR